MLSKIHIKERKLKLECKKDLMVKNKPITNAICRVINLDSILVAILHIIDHQNE